MNNFYHSLHLRFNLFPIYSTLHKNRTDKLYTCPPCQNYALLIINFGWVLFRVDGIKNALIIIKRMIIPTNFETTLRSYKIINFSFNNSGIFTGTYNCNAICRAFHCTYCTDMTISQIQYMCNPVNFPNFSRLGANLRTLSATNTFLLIN